MAHQKIASLDRSNQATGQIGEDLICKYLHENGYSICRRNYRCPYGEIDIIASKDTTTYFIEVKTRRGLTYGHPFESIKPLKISRIKKSIHHYREAEVVINPQILFASVILHHQNDPVIEVLPYEG